MGCLKYFTPTVTKASILVGAAVLTLSSLFWSNVLVKQWISLNDSSSGAMDAYRPSLMDTLAASHFLLDPKTNLILLHEEVMTVVIDIGARESDYLSAMENSMDPTVILMMFDPLPDSILPLIGRVGAYSVRERPDPRWLSPLRSNQVFAIRAAVGPNEGRATFNIGTGPACSSMLTKKENGTAFWCAESSRQIVVNVVTLESILRLIPPHIQSIHLKVDAEGFDLNVIKSGKNAIRRCKTIIIECFDKVGGADMYEGQCMIEEAGPYIQSHGFEMKWEKQGPSQGNGFFVNTNSTLPGIPPFFLDPFLTFGKWYKTLV